jgi:peptidoglycan hydrolase-like protein with peptidoglycan-binding domain
VPFVPTVISGAVGERALGKPAVNRADDVRKIQGLLKKVTGATPAGLQDGTWNPPMKSAVVSFQQIWGTADGRVDPAPGQTLKRLDRLANPLELKPISLGRVLEARRNGKVTAVATASPTAPAMMGRFHRPGPAIPLT